VRRIRATTTLAVAGLAMLSAMVASNASAQLFHASKIGTLKGKQLDNQELQIGAGLMGCTKAAASGRATQLLALSLLLTVQYSGCSFFSFSEIKINPAIYLLNADNGLVTLDGTVKMEIPLAGCSITFPPQTLTEVKYKNTAKKLTEESKVHSIKYTGSGGMCGGAGSSGTYIGNNELELEGGEISWS
jgi:hypothetical protein